MTEAGVSNPGVRVARESDAGPIAALWAAELGGSWGETQLRDDLARRLTRSWVCERDGRMLGFLHGHRAGTAFEILGLAVAAGARRRGVGRALVETAATAARGARLPCLQLEVRAGDAGARSFYSAAGFVAVGRRARYYRDGEDALLMTRALECDA